MKPDSMEPGFHLSVSLSLFRMNSFTWASSCTSAAIDTFVSVDDILAVASRNCTYWALAFTSTTHYAIVRNYMSHSLNFLKLLPH